MIFLFNDINGGGKQIAATTDLECKQRNKQNNKQTWIRFFFCSVSNTNFVKRLFQFHYLFELIKLALLYFTVYQPICVIDYDFSEITIKQANIQTHI